MGEHPDYARETQRAGLDPDEDDLEGAPRALVRVETAGDVHALVDFLGERGYTAAAAGENAVEVNLDDRDPADARRTLRDSLARWSDAHPGTRLELLP